MLAPLWVALGCEEPTRAPTATTTSSTAPPPAVSTAAATAAPERPSACRDEPGLAVLISPRAPEPSAVLRVLVASEQPREAELAIADEAGAAVARTADQGGGPPYWWTAELSEPQAQRYRVRFRAPGVHLCRDIAVGQAPQPRPRTPWGAAWPVVTAWDRDFENLYSAWLEKLFDDPLDASPTWPVLHEVLRDRSRNLLWGHLGYGEDDPDGRAPRIDPDCADLPYFFRAYFAFKLGLPFGYSRCTRATRSSPPVCLGWRSNLTARVKTSSADPIRRFAAFLRTNVADTVHTAALRTPPEAEASDLYPIALSARSLRPGAVFADPYGHTLIVVRRVPQTAERGGILLAVDGQPDGTVSRRRYWRGNFLFSDDARLGGPGFKRFRPVVVDGGRARALDNAEIERHPDYGDFSLEQYQRGVEGFYDAVDEVISPRPQDPERALAELLDAFAEQVERRVLSVQNGVDYRKGHPPIDMPDGAAIFQTVGPWEDFSTPSRDMRLLIAMDVVRGFAARVERRPERYAIGAGTTPAKARAALEALLERQTSSRRFRYRRSDGSSQELSLADVLERAEGLEMAYNPNDCPEKRWAAPSDSAERSTCQRHAPADQERRMERYRPWFAARQRPTLE